MESENSETEVSLRFKKQKFINCIKVIQANSKRTIQGIHYIKQLKGLYDKGYGGMVGSEGREEEKKEISKLEKILAIEQQVCSHLCKDNDKINR
jgi:hypothetical protein